jgi:competence protein ComEC
MLVVLVLSNQLGRGRNLLNSLLVAMSVILILFPDALISLSFYLSCLAILGIIVASNLKFKSRLLNALNISFFVNFYEAPLMINFFKNISIVSLVLNLIVIPYMGVLLPIGLIYIIVSLISVNIASHFSFLISLLYGILIFVVSVASRTPFSFAPGSFSLFQFITADILIFIATLYLLSKKNKALNLLLPFQF